MKVKEAVPSGRVVRVRTGSKESLSGPLTSSIVMLPLPLRQVRVKGCPSTTLKAVLVNSGLANTVAAKATTAATENFIVTGVWIVWIKQYS